MAASLMLTLYVLVAFPEILGGGDILPYVPTCQILGMWTRPPQPPPPCG